MAAIYPTAPPPLTAAQIEKQAKRFVWDFVQAYGKRPHRPDSWARACAKMAGLSGVDAERFAVTAARAVRA